MPHASSILIHRPRAARRAVLALLAMVLVAAAPVTAAQPAGDADPAVITNWNRVAAQTVPATPAAFLNYAFVHLAMYNAVVGITGEYELYQWDEIGPSKASPEAAAAVAAHRILMTYFGSSPTVAANLNSELAASLAGIPNGVRKNQGIKYGLRAAARIIQLRANDGRFASVMVPTGDAAGEWRPTPPANAAFAVPWLGGVTPLVLDSLTQLDPGPPPPIGSQRYRDDLEEVRLVGASVGAMRTGDQEVTARYFHALPFAPFEAGLRDMVSDQGLDISDSARVLAATNASIADALGTTWNGKLKYLWWRPITAIHEPDPGGDGDAATIPDPSWQPLIGTPPYPDWPSGLCAVIGAMTTSLEELTGEVDLTMSAVLPSGVTVERHFDSKADLDDQAVDARVWAGIHFRAADEASIEIGTRAAEYALDHYFAPID
jgi:hypothetical protein